MKDALVQGLLPNNTQFRQDGGIVFGGVNTTSPLGLGILQNWNNSGVVFTGLKFNITDAASSSSSYLFDFQFNGISGAFTLRKDGRMVVSTPNNPFTWNYLEWANDFGNIVWTFAAYSNRSFTIKPRSNLIQLSGNAILAWTSNVANDGTGSSGTADLKLGRDAANTLSQSNGASAQTFRAYNTFTDASNYERGVFDWKTTTNTLTIGTENAGTGLARNFQFVSGGVNIMDYGVTVPNTLTISVPVNDSYTNYLLMGY